MRRILLLSVLVLVLGGCETNDRDDTQPPPRPADEDPLTTVRLAPERMMDAATARVVTQAEIDVFGKRFSIEGEGEVDLPRRVSYLSLSVDGPVSKSVATELFLSGFNIFMRSPNLEKDFETVRWIEAHLSGFEFVHPHIDALGHLAHHDPITAVHFLRGAEDVQRLERRDVRGISTTGYRVRVDLSTGNALPANPSESLSSHQFHVWRWTRGSETIRVDVWVDDDGLVRRQRMPLKYNAGSAQGMSIDVTFDLFDLGTEVDIELPPRSEYVPLDELRV